MALLVLASLAEGQKHGCRMIQDIEEFAWERGWIDPVVSSGRRKPYRITESGRGVLREQLATLRRAEETGAGRLNIAWGPA
ncbi:PadR family transcriptional regulator [Nonomuraea wenchangensis]|uniref:PadR family transcriptional regulator n=1 Tax=Nonomuraea wenchangensis TaxID=568860 RepID=UPI0033FA3A1A